MTDSKGKDEKELNELKEKSKKSLEELILKKFPKKILQMKDLIEEKFNINKMTQLKTEVNIPVPDKPNSGQTSQEPTPQTTRTGLDKRVFLFPNGVNKTNEDIQQLIDCVKPLLLDFLSDIRLCKFAVQLMVPKVEDGNNFRVQIQSQAITAFSRCEKLFMSRLKQFGTFHTYRGRVVTWIARYPHCQDYRQCLKEEDQKFFLILCLIVRELRDNYVSINDMVIKNLDKIKNPKPNRHPNSMY